LIDEKRLIRKIVRNADRTAADTLVRCYYDEILSYAYKQTVDKQTAMDLTQDIFVAVLKHIARYDDEKAGFRTWLYSIATNKIIDHHRSRAKLQNKVLDLDDVDIPDENDFVRQLENSELLSQIQDYIGTFDADAQRIFRLKIYGGYTFMEIAAIIEITESTVKTKYYRMVKTVREKFKYEG
jgi:RNA polymerase sigma-70 factor (ECF subfamily)